jgi:hypothetical protein
MTSIVEVKFRSRMFTLRAHNQIMNAQIRETMTQIRDLCLPFHFMTEAYNRYPGVFRKRSRRWQMIKAAKVKHQRPNEWTGELRRAVLSESIVRATPTKGTLSAKAPLSSKIMFGKRAGQTQRRPLPDWQRDELEHVSPQEIENQVQRINDYYTAAMFDPVYQETILKAFR